MSFYEEGEKRVEFVEGVQDPEEVARVPIRGEREEVAERGRD